ncbi:MYB DNA-binding domain-containing protein [Dendryphion nanum]|uniref:MYB DNA-binding domain-containing protein n=1 Tax=Dendryphion nanum TaxID=256645 RepID=A0A9P9DL02_9PLEO|nr:MYB DNA-binding domain-containing protein [Dendryphion nanum]
MSHPSSSYDPPYGHPPQQSRKRQRQDDGLGQDLLNPIDQSQEPYAQAPGGLNVQQHHQPPQGYNIQPFGHPPPPPAALPPTHHHTLPNTGRNTKPRMDHAAQSPAAPMGPPSVVGQEGMPQPAPRPRGPKLKFTGEDDQLLIDLKEKKNLTWKQIADFFPGRSSGTLQVRYCTKLKAKTTVWTDEMVQKLRNAMQEYENDRWRIISSKVGSGFTPVACRDKASELDALEAVAAEEEEEEEQSGYTQAQLASGSSDPAASYQ